MKKESSDLFELIGEFLLSSQHSVTKNETKKTQNIEIEADRIVFNFDIQQVVYEGCQHETDVDSVEFLYNILNLHLKSKEAILQKDENCLSAVSNHELKNILASAQLSLEMLSTYDFDTIDRSKLLSQAFEAVSQSVSIFDEMIMIEKLLHQQKNNNITIEMVDVAAIAKKVIETLSGSIASKGLDVSLHDKSEGVLIKASAFWVERAIFNLISNAIKYNEQNGSVRVDVVNDNRFILVSIRDSGIGIKASEQEGILENFQTSKETQDKGTGIGLMLVKAVAEAHSGELSFESVQGEGSTFVLTLPKKTARQYIRHPMAVMNAASIALLVGLSYFFPVIPTFDTVEKGGAYETIKLQDGSSIKMEKGGEYSFWHLKNITGSKSYMRLSLASGKAEADLRGSKVNFVTPSISFVNLGTELGFEQTTDLSTVSVYKGEVQAKEIHLGAGEGLVSTAKGVEVTELLDAPYGMRLDVEDNGTISLHFDAVSGAEKYHIVLAKDEQFLDAVSIQESVERELSFDIKEDGYYYVKVSAIDKNGIMGYSNSELVKSIYNLKQGILLRNNGQFERAEAFFKKSASSFEQKDHEPYSEMGLNSFLEGEFAQAVRSYTEAVSINATEEDRLNLARALFYLNSYTKAQHLYDELLKEDPENEDALWAMADLEIAQKEYKKAKKRLQYLLRLNPRYPLANYDMARVMFMTNYTKQGFRYLDEEIRNAQRSESKEIAKLRVDADDPEDIKSFLYTMIHFYTYGQQSYIENEVAMMVSKAFGEY